MIEINHSAATVIVIFGGGGDLAWRKLVPALFNLYLDHWLPGQFAIIGVDLKSMSDQEFRDHLREGIDQFSRRGKASDADWNAFAPLLSYQTADFNDPASFSRLASTLAEKRKAWNTNVNFIYYQATPPATVELLVNQLGKAGLAKDRQHSRIILEKPFGHDLDSARALNQMLTAVFSENQIFRIDHYLGKETVQNILAFRFANAMFEPIWDRRYIDHIQITMAEEVGVEHRGGYYDHAGALRDMVQNHLLQVLCMIAMEPPVSFQDEEIRNKKADVLHALRPISEDAIHQVAVRGQYAAGWIEGEKKIPYRQEPGVSPDSNTETFAALKLFVDNWRWQDVPFYLRTGKCLSTHVSEVSILFRPVPHQTFPVAAIRDWQANRLVINIQPNEGIRLCFQAKRPGPKVHLGPVEMRFTYQDAFHSVPPEAYETLLLDGMTGDATLFMRADQVEAAWSVVMPVLKAWEASPAENFPNYPAGSWGPDEAQILISKDGRSWFLPDANGKEA
jgi:glucose-6-phosphate 1-dehydrogenase